MCSKSGFDGVLSGEDNRDEMVARSACARWISDVLGCIGGEVVVVAMLCACMCGGTSESQIPIRAVRKQIDATQIRECGVTSPLIILALAHNLILHTALHLSVHSVLHNATATATATPPSTPISIRYHI